VKEVNRAVLQQLSRIKAPNCPPLRALGDFLDGKDPDRQALEAHVRSCPSCLNLLIDLQELAFLQKEGEEPSRQVVEDVKALVPPAQAGQAVVPSLAERLAVTLSAIGKTLREWSSPRFLGEVAAAAAAAVFLVFIGTNVVQQKPPSLQGEGETIKTAADLSPPTRTLLTSLTQVSPSSASWWQQIATTLETIPATPNMEKTRGAKNIEVYKKAVAATVLIETDRGLGSGSVIGTRGEVLTNWHVIEGASRITVYFKPEEGGQARKDLAFTATPIKVDQVADLALLQIQAPPPGLHPLELGNLKELEVGQDVHAIGHPKGQAWTYTTGTISQIRPDYQWRDATLLHQGTVIQTQTPINPGNSGGPLLNDQAELIGVNSFIAAEAEGLNYAVAVDTVRAFLQKAASPPAPPVPHPGTVPSPSPAPSPVPVPGPGVPAYRMEPFGQQIVGVYVNARVPPPDVWLVYRDPARQHPAYAAKGSKTSAKIDTIVIGADPQWQALVYYFDTNCDGVIDLVGYDMEGNGKLERYSSPSEPLRVADLVREFASALQDGAIPYSQVQVCS
jgi:S1-C subfamily serine protease